MVIVYGADWCEDTQRSLRHLRRLSVPHRYLNIDEDLDALERATALSGGRRRTPIIDLGMSGPALVEPDNDTLAGALVEIAMLTADDVHERMSVQNVGDVDRMVRGVAGAALLAGAAAAPRAVRRPLAIAGGLLALTGVAGWCPVMQAAGLTSLGGPVDRPRESTRRGWFAQRSAFARATDAARGEGAQ
jgi:glutaredoxin